MRSLYAVPCKLECNCKHGLHDHNECKCSARCKVCNTVFFYRDAKHVLLHGVVETQDFDDAWYFVCPYCGSDEMALWDNSSMAAEMFPNGCTCQNNGDYCDYCSILIQEPRICQHCYTRIVAGYFYDGLWYEDFNTSEDDAYCDPCAERVMARAEEHYYDLHDCMLNE